MSTVSDAKVVNITLDSAAFVNSETTTQVNFTVGLISQPASDRSVTNAKIATYDSNGGGRSLIAQQTNGVSWPVVTTFVLSGTSVQLSDRYAFASSVTATVTAYLTDMPDGGHILVTFPSEYTVVGSGGTAAVAVVGGGNWGSTDFMSSAIVSTVSDAKVVNITLDSAAFVNSETTTQVNFTVGLISQPASDRSVINAKIATYDSDAGGRSLIAQQTNGVSWPVVTTFVLSGTSVELSDRYAFASSVTATVTAYLTDMPDGGHILVTFPSEYTVVGSGGTAAVAVVGGGNWGSTDFMSSAIVSTVSDAKVVNITLDSVAFVNSETTTQVNFTVGLISQPASDRSVTNAKIATYDSNGGGRSLIAQQTNGVSWPVVRSKCEEASQNPEESIEVQIAVEALEAAKARVVAESKKPKSVGSLDVFSASAAGALPAVWAKLPQSLVLEGEKKGWKKITKRSKCFLLKKEPKQRKQKERTSEKMIVFDHLTTHNSTVLNNELNWRNTDWAKEAREIKSLLAKSKQ